jgi:Sec20
VKVADYDLQARKLDMIIRNDEVGLLMLEQGNDPSQNQGRKTGGMYDNAVVKHGFDTQSKSKDALNRI